VERAGVKLDSEGAVGVDSYSRLVGGEEEYLRGSADCTDSMKLTTRWGWRFAEGVRPLAETYYGKSPTLPDYENV